MEADGGGLPQRPPRSRRRPASSADPQGDAERGPAKRAADNATDRSDGQQSPSGNMATADADQPAATAAAQPPPMLHISDNHTSAALRSAKVDGYNFEYLDHTADIQLHAWGSTVQQAFEQVALAMFNYMTPLSGISIDESSTRTYAASGHDMHSLLFNFLDELLFVFSTELFVPLELHIAKFNRTEWQLEATGKGEMFSRQKHPQGTEVKAITYSAMDVREQGEDVEVFVIVDI